VAGHRTAPDADLPLRVSVPFGPTNSVRSDPVDSLPLAALPAWNPECFRINPGNAGIPAFGGPESVYSLLRLYGGNHMLTRSCLRLEPDVVRRLRALNLAPNFKNNDDRRWTVLARKVMELGLLQLEREMGVKQ
jgi:hypothetical protein